MKREIFSGFLILGALSIFLLLITIFLTPSMKEKYSTDEEYIKLRESFERIFSNKDGGVFSLTNISSVMRRFKTNEPVVALTFDACGGVYGNGYDSKMTDFLITENISATMFISGKWLSSHKEEVKAFAENPLFTVENHGLTHRPLSVSGKEAYGIKGTENVGEVVDEVEINARIIEEVTGRRPLFFRAGTAFHDETAVLIAETLGHKVVNFDVISADANKGITASDIVKEVLSSVTNGSIIIMHINHPEKNGFVALKEIVNSLKRRGYSFVTLEEVKDSLIY